MNVRYSKLKELIESDRNGDEWFNTYQDVDHFLLTELNKLDINFPIVDKEKPQINTIEAVKLLIENNKL